MIHSILVILALLVLAPLLSRLPLSAMAALLLMVAWNMSEAHKVVDLLRHAPKDDIIVMLLCMSLTVLFDMVIAISVGIVLASLLFMRRIARMTRLAPVAVDVLMMCWSCVLLARCFSRRLKVCSPTRITSGRKTDCYSEVGCRSGA